MDKKFIRGLDLKLRMDAHVIVFDDRELFKFSDVLQAIGRGSRSQGQSSGTIFVLGDPIGDISGLDKIKARSTLQNDAGGENLRKLFEVSKRIAHRNLDWVEESFSRGRWQVDPLKFEKANPETWKILQDPEVEVVGNDLFTVMDQEQL